MSTTTLKPLVVVGGTAQEAAFGSTNGDLYAFGTDTSKYRFGTWSGLVGDINTLAGGAACRSWSHNVQYDSATQNFVARDAAAVCQIELVTETGVRYYYTAASGATNVAPTWVLQRKYDANGNLVPRVFTEASNATPAPNVDNYDIHKITALAVSATVGAPTGTPSDGQFFEFVITDNGGAQTLGWNSAFAAKGVALPTTTVATKELRVLFQYNSATSKWGCVASLQE